jgi:hypothetical protein
MGEWLFMKNPISDHSVIRRFRHSSLSLRTAEHASKVVSAHKSPLHNNLWSSKILFLDRTGV